jgi:hypothetical protein
MILHECALFAYSWHLCCILLFVMSSVSEYCNQQTMDKSLLERREKKTPKNPNNTPKSDRCIWFTNVGFASNFLKVCLFKFHTNSFSQVNYIFLVMNQWRSAQLKIHNSFWSLIISSTLKGFFLCGLGGHLLVPFKVWASSTWGFCQFHLRFCQFHLWCKSNSGERWLCSWISPARIS